MPEEQFGLISDQWASLPERQRVFLADLARVIERRRIPGLAPAEIAASLQRGTVTMELPSPVAPESNLLLTIDPDEVVISCEWDHWHHARDDVDAGRVYPWSGSDGIDVALQFIDALLGGTIEIELRYGFLSTAAITRWIEPTGERHLVQRSRTLLPPFKLGRQTYRVDFGPGP